MNPGDLNKRIVFEKKLPVVRDEMGGKKPAEYEQAFSLWAAKSTKPAIRRDYMADKVNYVSVFFTVRKYTDKLPDTMMRIIHAGAVYDILNITDLETSPGYLEIETVLVQ
nr:MAG TPA: head tail joining protein [Caudoviricetes sp.]